ncbi:MAG: group 1 glycosyl transferase [Parcubacteria group bacterium Gr01-1014_38]|nr:MAG: group 1 glycosyl transferase [Parcubacteria group bacterium Gr01-1014_38]
MTASPPLVALEARALSGPAGGVVRYIRGLLDGFTQLDPPLTLTVICDHQRGQTAVRNFPSLAVPPATPWLRPYWNLVALPRAIRRLRPRLVHLTKPSGTPFRRGFPPVVTTIYDVISLTHPRTQTVAQRTYWRLELPAAARHATAIVTISEASKRAIVDTLGVPADRITVTTPGIEPTFAPAAPDARAALLARLGLGATPYVLTVGTIEPRKNVDRLLRAFARVVGEFPHTLVIAGRWGWKTERVVAAARDPRLKDRVCFLGRVESADLPTLYGSADAFAFLSQDEGFGFPPLEAMACGTPVLVSARGSLPEVVGPAALLVDPEDEEEITSALRLLLADQGVRTRLVEQGRAWIQQFTWERTARQTLEVYARVLEHTGEPERPAP